MSNIISITKSNKKFAVLIGINYTGSPSQLNGCINDALNLKTLLIDKLGFLPENIIVMTDDSADPNLIPTNQNIKSIFNTMIQKSIEGFTELWFSYSGHGSYVFDTSGDEDDYYDEVLCPIDYDTNGMIDDDYIYDNFICALPEGVRLFGLLDCCHSGTMFDLPYIYLTSLADNKPTNTNINKKVCKAKVVSISGCKDSQTSADAFINSKYAGAMTWSFLKTVSETNYTVKLTELVEKMRQSLAGKYTQVPMLALTNSDDLNMYFIQSTVTNTITNTNNIVTKPVKFLIKVDYWYNESSWNIFSVTSNKNIYDIDKKFVSKYQSVELTQDLPIGSYKLILKDSHGDGGLSGTITLPDKKILSFKMAYSRLTEFPFVVA